MNTVKESLEANMTEILANLPEEFHADLKKQVADAPAPQAPLSGAAEVEAIKAELVANPDVDESAAAGELKDIKAPEAIVPATKGELEKQQAEMLAEAEKSAKS